MTVKKSDVVDAVVDELKIDTLHQETAEQGIQEVNQYEPDSGAIGFSCKA